jgi:hypothetical protein
VNAVIDHVQTPGVDLLPDRRQTTRVAACIAISLAMHAMLLSSYHQPRPAALPAREPLTVRLQDTPKTPPAVEPTRPAAQPEAQPEARPEARPKPAPRARTPRRIIAVPPPSAPSSEEKLHVDTPPADTTPANTPAEATPHFDLDAARSVARKVANEPDPARAGTALERLPPPPLQTETKLERGIRSAKRPYCKDGVPGGLLAPLYLAMDKKDSGCKW